MQMINNPSSIFSLIKRIHKMKKPPKLKCASSVAKSRNINVKQHKHFSIRYYKGNGNRMILPSLSIQQKTSHHIVAKGKSLSVDDNRKKHVRYTSILGKDGDKPFIDNDSSSQARAFIIDDKVDFIKTHLELKPGHYSRNSHIKITAGNMNLEDMAEGMKTYFRTKLVERNGLLFYEFDYSKPNVKEETKKTLQPFELKNHPKAIELLNKYDLNKKTQSKFLNNYLRDIDNVKVCLRQSRTYRNLQGILYKRNKYHQEGVILKSYQKANQ